MPKSEPPKASVVKSTNKASVLKNTNKASVLESLQAIKNVVDACELQIKGSQFFGIDELMWQWIQELPETRTVGGKSLPFQLWERIKLIRKWGENECKKKVTEAKYKENVRLLAAVIVGNVPDIKFVNNWDEPTHETLQEAFDNIPQEYPLKDIIILISRWSKEEREEKLKELLCLIIQNPEIFNSTPAHKFSYIVLTSSAIMSKLTLKREKGREVSRYDKEVLGEIIWNAANCHNVLALHSLILIFGITEVRTLFAIHCFRKGETSFYNWASTEYGENSKIAELFEIVEGSVEEKSEQPIKERINAFEHMQK